MDEKQTNQSGGAAGPKSDQLQPVAGASSAIAAAASLSGAKPGVTDTSAPPTAKAETAKQRGGLTEVLEASRAELDRLLAETQIIHERSWRVIHTLLEDSQLRASQAVDACLASFEKNMQDRISNEMAVSLQNFDIEVGARLAARLDQALTEAKQRQRTVEQDLAMAITEDRKQLDQLSVDTEDRLRQSEQSLLGDLQKEAERQIRELAESASQIDDNIRRLGETVASNLKQRTEEAVSVFQSRIEQVWQEAVGRAEKRITEAVHTSTAELAKLARQVLDREMSEFLSHALRRFDRSSQTSSNQGD